VSDGEPTEAPPKRWGAGSIVAWILAAIVPLYGYVLSFAGSGTKVVRLRDSALAWLLGGLFSAVVGLVGMAVFRRPVRVPDVLLVLYGLITAVLGFSRCAGLGFGEHPCW
jgi:hypothetical protein